MCQTLRHKARQPAYGIIDVTADSLSLKGALSGHTITADLLSASGLDVHLKPGDGAEPAAKEQAAAAAAAEGKQAKARDKAEPQKGAADAMTERDILRILIDQAPGRNEAL